MAKFQPGTSGNKAGRPKGSTNILTKQLKDKLKILIDTELDALPELLAGLEPDKRLDIIIKLLAYSVPKILPQAASFGEPQLKFDPETDL